MAASTQHGSNRSLDSSTSQLIHNDLHFARRIFIGPMPEKVVSHTERIHKRHRFLSRTADVSDEVSSVIKRHAYHFFIHSGGNAEQWDEDEERSIREQLLKRWRESEWGTAWNHRRSKKDAIRQTPSYWVGGSFEIGLLGFGVPIQPIKSNQNSTADSARGVEGTLQTLQTPAAKGKETFMTAFSRLEIPAPSGNLLLSSNGNGVSEMDAELASPAGSSTGLLGSSTKEKHRSRSVIDNIRARALRIPSVDGSSFQARTDANAKGKQRIVQHENTPRPGETPGPAPPSQVLGRTKSTVEPTSSAAAASTEPPTVSQSPSNVLEWGDAVMRDRMLVRISYSKSETLSPRFNEVINRTTRDLHYEDWTEFLVAWRRDYLEIYEDYTIPGKEWVTGHKHLSYVIPLKSSRTHLSLYSFVDLTFCITCPPTTTRLNAATSRWIFSREKEGTNIFVFKLKSRSRAYNWTWEIWRQMGGTLPTTIEIRNPTMDTKVKIDIPSNEALDADQEHQLLKRQNIITLCIESLRSVPDWNNLIEREILQGGKTLQLAWRVDTTLDWVCLDDDVYGNERESIILWGLAFKQSLKPPLLEIRLAEHAPTHLHLKNGKSLSQPLSIEGYAERIRPNTQTKQPLYLATHNGNLFALSPNNAYPPTPPGLEQPLDADHFLSSFRRSEVSRGAKQIMHATGVCDLRNVVAVRRAVQLVPPHMHKEKETLKDDDTTWFGIWSQTEERVSGDEDDEGGEGGLTKTEDKPRLRMKRSFELLLISGHVIRFEVHSRRVALEWIERLRALIIYWKHRHRIDAKDEIELAQARRPRLTPQTRVCQDEHEIPPDPPADLSAPYTAMNSLYNWCVLDRCNPITKGGRVYMRKGLRGQYKLIQLFIVNGHLVRFNIKPNSSLHPAIQKKTNLLDAYICSGYFAALTLPQGQYNPNAEVTARRYQDGLEADDPEEDMLFMVWYHPVTTVIEGEGVTGDGLDATPKPIPELTTKRKLIIFRTRSKLERDAWCWALNCEIESLVRVQTEREDKIRNLGNLKKL